MLCKIDGCERDAEAVSYFCSEHSLRSSMPTGARIWYLIRG